MVDDAKPSLLFILGRGRSGTTLLSKILNAHEQVAVAPEGFFAFNLMNSYKNAFWDQRTIQNFLFDLKRENRMKTWQLDLNKLKSKLSNDSSQSYEEVCRLVYQQYAEKIGKPSPVWVGDKNPHYALFPQRLLEAFPNSKAILLTRDYRDNILSYQQVPFDADDTKALAYRWYHYNSQLEKVAKSHPNRTVWLKYEELTANPEDQLKGVCEFLRIPYQSLMLTFYEGTDKDFYGQHSPWFKETQEPLSPKHQKKWKEKIDLGELKLADHLCQPLGRKLGYLPAFEHFNFLLNVKAMVGFFLVG